MRRTLLCLLTFASLLGGNTTEAGSINLTPTRDNTLFQSATGATSNGSGDFFYVGSTRTLEIRRGLLAFDVASAIPAGSTITSAELSVALTRTPPLADGTMHNFSLHRTLADWGEGASDSGPTGGFGAAALAGDATWVHTFSPGSSWASTGGDYVVAASGTTLVGTAAGAYSWSSSSGMVADVQSWLDNPSQNFGWIVRGEEVTQKSARQFGTREHPIANQRPVLTIQYSEQVPEPSAVALSLFASLGMLSFVRHTAS